MTEGVLEMEFTIHYTLLIPLAQHFGFGDVIILSRYCFKEPL